LPSRCRIPVVAGVGEEQKIDAIGIGGIIVRGDDRQAGIAPGREVTREEINQAMSAAAAKGPLRGILAVTDDAVVSVDMNHTGASATIALPQTQVVGGGLVRVLAWYDNEWAFSTRMADVALAMARAG